MTPGGTSDDPTGAPLALGPVPPVDRSADYAKVIERRVRQRVRQFRKNAYGLHPRHCPLCGYFGAFTPFGLNPRIDAQCAKCGSLERHRQVMLLIERSGLFDGARRVLHFAPEAALTGVLRARAAEYVTADLMRGDVDLRLNIEAIDLEDGSFDRIVCNHVLEHVDDRKALAEIFRVLAPGGIALLSTPIVEGWARTYENPAITEPAMRVLHFGQDDHARFFGRDFRDRVSAAGFTLEEFVAEEPDVSTFGLLRGECLFLARKPGRRPPKKGGRG